MATFWPTRALVSVDLPALGRPTRQANPARYAALSPPWGAVSSVPACVPMGILRLGVVAASLLCRDAVHDDRCHAVAATGHALGRQLEPGDAGRRADDRHPADGLGEEPADG